MFEKNLTMGYLLDFYGDLLAERRRELMSLYYNEDYSLAEIAAEVGISRQGVRDAIKRGEEELRAAGAEYFCRHPAHLPQALETILHITSSFDT